MEREKERKKEMMMVMMMKNMEREEEGVNMNGMKREEGKEYCGRKRCGERDEMWKKKRRGRNMREMESVGVCV